jgi:hypothetical protein
MTSALPIILVLVGAACAAGILIVAAMDAEH